MQFPKKLELTDEQKEEVQRQLKQAAKTIVAGIVFNVAITLASNKILSKIEDADEVAELEA